MSVTMAPFETFAAHAKRAQSDEPYSDEFINRCREKALEYDKLDVFLRGISLNDLKMAVPYHRTAEVFAGISWREPGR